MFVCLASVCLLSLLLVFPPNNIDTSLEYKNINYWVQFRLQNLVIGQEHIQKSICLTILTIAFQKANVSDLQNPPEEKRTDSSLRFLIMMPPIIYRNLNMFQACIV